MKNKAIFYFTPNQIIDIYKKKEFIDYKVLGIHIYNKIPICKILYQKDGNYDPKMIPVVDSIAQNIVIMNYQLGQSVQTIHSKVQNTLKFINWLKDHNSKFLENKQVARDSLEQYIYFLKTEMRIGNIQIDNALTKQNLAISFLKNLHNDNENYIASSVRLISNSANKKSSTPKPNSEHFKYLYKFYRKLFEEICEFLINQKSYPYHFEILRKSYCFMPFEKRFPAIVNKEFQKKFQSYDFNNQKILSGKEIADLFGCSRIDGNNRRYQFKKSIESKNIDKSCNARLYLGTLGIKAFFILFLMTTGMNDSTASTLKWNKNYQINKIRQKFRNIKYRAGNKVVEFEIGTKFLKQFQQFILLREFVLNGNESEYLFFTGYGENTHLNSEQISGKLSGFINRYFQKNIDSDLPIINSRQLRVNKAFWVSKQYNEATSSLMIQSSLSVAIDNYSGETDESSAFQITNYYEKFNNKIFQNNQSYQTTNVGSCANSNNLKTTINQNPEHNCSMQYGCLGCEYHRVNIDEIDIRKLLSAKFVIQETKSLSKNEEQFNNILLPYSNKIDEILNKMVDTDTKINNLIHDVKKDVFENENLFSYWQHKYNMLIRIGVL